MSGVPEGWRKVDGQWVTPSEGASRASTPQSSRSSGWTVVGGLSPSGAPGAARAGTPPPGPVIPSLALAVLPPLPPSGTVPGTIIGQATIAEQPKVARPPGRPPGLGKRPPWDCGRCLRSLLAPSWTQIAAATMLFGGPLAPAFIGSLTEFLSLSPMC